MSLTLKPLNEQVMVITGASSGIGLATAEAAAERGVKLVLAARSEQTMEDVSTRLSASGAEVMFVPADVGQRDQVERIATEAVSRFGRIDTWVNNAGVSIYGRLDEVTEQDSRRLFDTNFWGVSMAPWPPSRTCARPAVPSSMLAARSRTPSSPCRACTRRRSMR